MEKMTAGLIAMGIVATLQGAAWICGVNGVVTSTLSTILGLIAGSIFGFSIAIKETKTEEKEK